MDKIFLNFSFSLLSGIFAIFAMSFLGFIFKIDINPFYTIIGIIISFYILNNRCRNDKIEDKKIVLLNKIFALTIIILWLLSANFPDLSWDGTLYHQPGAYLMAKGYNPIYDNIYEISKKIHPLSGDVPLWIECYPKFSEIFGANIFSLTKNIESGKIFNYLAAIIAFCYLFYIFSKKQFFNADKTSLPSRFIFSFLLIYNPVVLCQLSTYYIDGLLYLYFLTASLSVVDFYLDKENRIIPLLIFTMSSVILANIKLGGLLCFICLVLSGLFFMKNIKKLKLFYSSVLISIFLILISGINPYFTNINQGRHPFYPLAGEGKTDIITPSIPASFRGKSSLYKFFVSTFSKPENITYKDKREPVLKIPFSISKGEGACFRVADVRISGFGIFFSGILILSIIALFTTKYKTFENKKIFLLLHFLFLLPVILNPENWWARYIPYFWAFIIFTIAGYYINACSKFEKLFSYIMIVLVFLNCLNVNINVIMGLLIL